jgi:predicted flap endonuclease-1-like 5' DNA nuclease
MTIMDTANTSYTFGMATGEIITLLLLTFLMGMLLCWLLRQMGLCCQTRKKTSPLGINPAPNGKYQTRDLHTPMVKPLAPEVYVPKVKIQPRIVDLPNIDIHKPTIDMPEAKLPEAELTLLTVEYPDTALHASEPTLPKAELTLPTVEYPDTTLHLPKVELPEVELELPEVTLPEVKPNLLATIDPHKPILDMPDMGNTPDITLDTTINLDTKLEIPTMPMEPLHIELPSTIELPEIDPLLAAIDPHKPIIDPPDIEEWETPQEAPTMTIEPLNENMETPKYDPLLAAIDPHKPIIDPPEPLEEAPANADPEMTTGSGIFNDWLHKAKESVEHLTERATPATNEWLHKAKESVEHLTEKATPTTSEWLHKAKEIGSELSAKGSSLASSETLVKGSSTLAALAASAKELTEKLASNLSIKHDDLQKLAGIGPTFASVLHRAGIHTYEQLAETSTQKLQALLIVEDEQFSQHDTSSWPKQAALAAQGEWEQLKAYQDSL